MTINIGTELDFTKNKDSWAALGIAVITEIKTGRVQTTYSLVTKAKGKKVGANYTVKIRHGNRLLAHCEVVGTDVEAAKEVQQKRRELSKKRYEAAVEAEQFFAPGDIVNIRNTFNSSWDSWNMKVLEIDINKGEIRGVSADFSPSQISGKMASAPLASTKVAITMVKKAAFDPKTDASVAAMQARRDRTTAKRNATRDRRATLRNIYGY